MIIRAYYLLTKPGIIFGNALTMAAGFSLAIQGPFPYRHFFTTLLGLSCIIASACIFNNCIDREADSKMHRTKNRALVTGAIELSAAVLFASILLLFGTFVLYFATNLLALLLAIGGFALYVFVYTYLKYQTTHGTLLGSFAGAVPPLVGYAAATGRIDEKAALLFAIVTLWQMPHFYAIAIYRLAEYKAASIPVLPVKSGIPTTKLHMALYASAFLVTSLLPTIFGYTGMSYLAAATLLGAGWLFQCLRGFKADNSAKWARTTFLFSLVVIFVLCLLISVDKI